MPTPRKNETREQMNERLRGAPKPIIKSGGTPLASYSFEKARWAKKTISVYDVVWRAFVAYAAKQGVEEFPAPAECVASFLPVYAADHSTSTVSLSLCA